MAGFKFMKVGDIKSYLYRSKSKVDWLYEQIQHPKSKRTVTWKIDLKVISRESQRDRPSDQEKLEAVVAALEERQLIGGLDDSTDFIKGEVPMRWGVFDDESFRSATEGPLVYFSGCNDGQLVGLGGSSFHMGNPYGIGGTGSCSNTPALSRWLRSGLDTGIPPPHRYHERSDTEKYQIAEAMVLADHFLKGPIQELEFVAKVLWRGSGYKLRPWTTEDRGEVILGTPLYVAQVHPKIVDA